MGVCCTCRRSSMRVLITSLEMKTESCASETRGNLVGSDAVRDLSSISQRLAYFGEIQKCLASQNGNSSRTDPCPANNKDWAPLNETHYEAHYGCGARGVGQGTMQCLLHLMIQPSFAPNQRPLQNMPHRSPRRGPCPPPARGRSSNSPTSSSIEPGFLSLACCVSEPQL